MTQYLMKSGRLVLLGLLWVPTLIAEPVPPGDKPVQVVRDTEPDLQDPTQMNQNFRAALTRMAQAKGSGNGGGVAIPVLPDIKLLASLLGNEADQRSSALLKIGDKSYPVHEKDIVTAYASAKTQLDVELQVMEIHKHFVKLMMISPINKLLILR